MQFIVKLYPEILLKSKPVRMRFSKILESNIRNVLNRFSSVKVIRNWDKITVVPNNISDENLILNKLKNIPGIDQINTVSQSEFKTIHDIYLLTYEAYKDLLVNKTFCVRVKRNGNHEFNSLEVERYVGGGLNQNAQSNGVKLKNPDITIFLEINNNLLFLITTKTKGLGGFPIAAQEDVLSLISGGFDSGLSSFQLIRKGARTHYCFFNLGGSQHEIGVKQVAFHIWDTYGSSHKVKFITVPFEDVVTEILEKIDNGLMGVILKRMMIKVATKIAERLNINALVTGESLGQVSSQTLTNLNVIDKASDLLVLRPLIALDKQYIIDQCRIIGTEDFAKTIPEYCGVISQKPTVKADLAKVLIEEEKFSSDLVDQIITKVKVMSIKDVTTEESINVTSVKSEFSSEIIIDIRPPEEEEKKPLSLNNAKILVIPFFKLATEFAKLDQTKEYLLYCEHGVMSKLQSLYLADKGYKNVNVFRPMDKKHA